MSVDIKIDPRAVEEALDQLDARSSKTVLQKATMAGVKYLKRPVQAEARKVSRRLARAVSARSARKNRPAGILTFRPKIAFFRHFVIGGTQAHSTRRRRGPGLQAFSDGGIQKFSRGHDVRSVRANPIISRVADREGDDALDATERELVKQLGLE